MTSVNVKQVKKTYTVPKQLTGRFSSIRRLFSREKTLVHSLKGISFQIDKGECVGVLGPNGCGKSTLIKTITGLIQPTDGEVTVFNQKPSIHNIDFLKQIGVVFGHKNSLWWDLPLQESLQSHCVMYGISPPEQRERLPKILAALNLDKILERPVKLMSLGERVKSELACQMLHKPKLLVLDEPTVGLDVTSKLNLRQQIKKWCQEEGVSVLITTHDMNDVEACCDRIIMMQQGLVTYDGELSALEKLTCQYKVLQIEGLESSLSEEQKKQLVSKAKECSLLVDNQNPILGSHKVELFVKPELSLSDITPILKGFDDVDVQLRRPSLESVFKESLCDS